MSGHTPGPWNYRPAEANQFPKFWINAPDVHTKTIEVQPHGRFIGQVGTGAGDEDELEANARLIAAAPEMYEALKEITRLRYVSKIAVAVAEKAIAKATGGGK